MVRPVGVANVVNAEKMRDQNIPFTVVMTHLWKKMLNHAIVNRVQVLDLAGQGGMAEIGYAREYGTLNKRTERRTLNDGNG